MAEIVKPDMTALWASGGAVVAPSRNKINEGWTAEIPPHQWENFVQLRQDEAIAYLYQRGIAEWDNTTEYFANKSVVLYNGSLYIAIVNNQNVNPANTTRWKPITGNATTSTAGLMTPEDKLKIDGIEAGAQKNVVLSVAGKVGAVSLSKADVGLSNVDNTTDAQKPLSNAAINAINTKAPINSPTFTGTVRGVTKSMVGLGNVDNTSDLSKPISTATQTAISSKANTHNPTFTGTVGGITKGMVGLGNVNNTSDLNKPISTATQAAIDAINTNTSSKANTSTSIIAGTGLTGGGTLAANRTLNVSYGTTAGTAAQGNDSRIVNASNASNLASGTVPSARLSGTYGISITGNAATSSRLTSVDYANANLNNAMTPGFYHWTTGQTNAPTDYASMLTLSWDGTGGGTAEQLVLKNGSMWIRGKNNSSSNWSAWSVIYHSGNLPTTATRWPTWSEVSSKPSTFTPSSHNHSAANITSGTINGARMPMGHGGVGTYAIVTRGGVGSAVSWGNTIAGSTLRTSSFHAYTSGASQGTATIPIGSALSGTWRIMGNSLTRASTTATAVLAVRIS